MRKAITLIMVLIFVAGSASAAFKENMGVSDDAQASVDRPLINHFKAFTSNYIPPLYDLITAIEDFFSSSED